MRGQQASVGAHRPLGAERPRRARAPRLECADSRRALARIGRGIRAADARPGRVVRLVVVTQRVDPDDPALGATVPMLRELAARVDELVVLTLAAREAGLPDKG